MESCLLLSLAYWIAAVVPASAAGPGDPSAQLPRGAELAARYNVVWASPSIDASGVMPIGNGDVAAGVYAIRDGALHLLLAKNDAFNFRGDLFKTGRIKIALTPNPFESGKPFRQTLDLPTASILFEGDGVKIRVWADANKPLVRVGIESASDLEASVTIDRFERVEFLYGSWQGKWRESETQDTITIGGNQLVTSFAVGDRSDFMAEFEKLGIGAVAAVAQDPYRFNTFGNLVESPQLVTRGDALVGKGREFEIKIWSQSKQEPDFEKWLGDFRQLAQHPDDVREAWKKHREWWSAFWERSWIIASDSSLPAAQRELFTHESTPRGLREDKDGAAIVAQNYTVFRYLMAAQSRGQIQAKFNGGLFTQELRIKGNAEKPQIQGGARPGARFFPEQGYWLTHPDWRLWGSRFTFQNQRLLYWPLLKSGDFDVLQPFFQFYSRVLSVRVATTKNWFGHEGAYFRENIAPHGGELDSGGYMPPKTPPGDRSKQNWHSYYFTSGLETAMMMIEQVKYSPHDQTFRDEVMVPFAREVLRFYDRRYPRDENGKIRLDPSQALETFWYAVNPASDVSGLIALLDELNAMQAGSTEDRREWKRMRGEVPDLHFHEIQGDRVIAPALHWENKRNTENSELYPAFPFLRYGVAHGSGDLVARTAKHRTAPNALHGGGWNQDEIHWAYAGNADEAAAGLVKRARQSPAYCRFPLYGQYFADGLPNFPHTGAAATALQRMLVQEAGPKIVLLPAWPKTWNADFKLHLTGGTLVSRQVKEGRLVSWNIQPEERRKDVVVAWESNAPASPSL
jgi:alpha-L-fucosidase 2